MPFGLRNAGQTFQCLMDQILSGLPFTFVYIDDVLVASTDMKTHLQHMRLVLEIFDKNGLVINPAKCEFGKSTVSFLGHQVTSTGVVPLTKHVEAIKSFARPGTKLQLQRFLGLINF